MASIEAICTRPLTFPTWDCDGSWQVGKQSPARAGLATPHCTETASLPLAQNRRSVSISNVTGPTFTSATSIIAPKRPVTTGTPSASAS